MNDPILVEVTRGSLVESRHAGRAVVVDADGAILFSAGNVNAPIFPRSAVKALQALPLVESGAADAHGFTEEMLALACASHGGEAGHVETAAGALAKLGLDESALECGAHWPSFKPAGAALAREGRKPSCLHNNCSGKHSGFLCLACHMEEPTQGYIQPGHAVQREVKAALEGATGAVLPDGMRGIDGCGIPTFAAPLVAWARGFARFGTGHGFAPDRAKAAARLRAAVAAHPWHVAGTGRFCTEVMQLLGSRAFIKTGAEGVFLVALPEQGLGIAVKADDGGTRASEVATAALIARFLPMDDPTRAGFERFVRPELKNWTGTLVGGVRPAGALA
ncbi:asparaginase [Agaricicola taiwanensis]|uniref:Asparaginase n=1 Tax=Agaricicola taiwanensis TaxID=591372 RepID=A0A8J3DZT7_9RHOB|nr:asparaginase [Agaricicola taiwanensis]GGE51909.1 asparaginase [Agaricicola taiwanensis]